MVFLPFLIDTIDAPELQVGVLKVKVMSLNPAVSLEFFLFDFWIRIPT